MAMACLRLFTVPPFPPFPDFRVPRFSRCIALLTLLPAALPYLRPPDLLRELAAISPSYYLGCGLGTGLSVAQRENNRFSRIVESAYGVLVVRGSGSYAKSSGQSAIGRSRGEN